MPGIPRLYFFIQFSQHAARPHHLSVIDFYFASLPDLIFPPKEGVQLLNTQPVTMLAFRMMAHTLSAELLAGIRKEIWSRLSRICRLPKTSLEPAKYGSAFPPTFPQLLGFSTYPTAFPSAP